MRSDERKFVITNSMKEEIMYKRNKHRPFHLYVGHTYFISGRAYTGYPYLKDDSRKKFFCKKLGELAIEMHVSIFSYVVLENHYHLLFSLYPQDELAFVTPHVQKAEDKRSEKLAVFIRRLHTITAKKWNDEDHTTGRKVWYQYWDYCIQNKADFWSHFNYIVKNPYKHGLVSSLESGYTYEYSSNPVWLKRFGKDGLWESFIRYPVTEVSPVELTVDSAQNL